MKTRKKHIQQVNKAFKINPVVALLGPRQCGKTTLAREYLKTIKNFSPLNRLGFEFKYNDSPSKTKSMQSALELLKLDQLLVIYLGDLSYPIDKKIKVIGLIDLLSGAKKLF